MISNVTPMLLDSWLKVTWANGKHRQSGGGSNYWKLGDHVYYDETEYWNYEASLDVTFESIPTAKEIKDRMKEGFHIVNKPRHYNMFKMEAIDVIKNLLTEEEYVGYLKGNMLKYRLRAGFKEDREQDLAKSNWYQDRLGAGATVQEDK